MVSDFYKIYLKHLFSLQFLSSLLLQVLSKNSRKMFSLLRQGFKFSTEYNKIVYVNGKSALSISQMIGENGQYLDPMMNNFYIKQHTEHEIKHEGSLKSEILQNQKKLLQTVLQKDLLVRCIIAPQISRKEMNLNINKLKKNPLLNHLIQLREMNEFKSSAPRILINSYMHLDQSGKILQQESQPGLHKQFKQQQLPVHEAMHGKDTIKQQVWVDKGLLVHQVEEHLQKNIVQLEKLFVDGLGLDLSFMLSKRNLHHPIIAGEKQKKNLWLNCISTKSKAIHSNIIQNNISLADTIHQEGYQLHHLFLSSFNEKKQRISFLDENKAYNLRQIIYILSTINFNGKLVLDFQDPMMGTAQGFQRNFDHLDKVLKQIGYKKTSIDDLDDDSYISAL